jgi:uncharacterized membrane protein YeaQ/YmgE (transglycosylase-associated protein family)
MKSISWNVVIKLNVVIVLLLVFATPYSSFGDASVKEQASEAVNESAQAVAEGFSELQNRMTENRLANRTSDEIVAFVLMGVLVASITGMFSKTRGSGLDIMGRLGLGLCGAFVGGMLVRIVPIDYEWGEVVLTYEEFLFSLLGAIVIIILPLLIKQLMKSRKAKSKS